MPNLALASSGITFPDSSVQTTSATAANAIGTTQLAANAVTTAKIAANAVTATQLGTNEQKQICKSWVNFCGTDIGGPTNGASGDSIVATSGSSVGVWNVPSTVSRVVGVVYYITSIGGTSGATLGGLNVATTGVQITAVNSGTQYAIKFLAGSATSSQTATGNGTSSGFSFSTNGIRSSYNVSSITKNGTGDYTINFATPMADANYNIAGSARRTGFPQCGIVGPKDGGQYDTAGVRLYVTDDGATAIDSTIVGVHIFGN